MAKKATVAKFAWTGVIFSSVILFFLVGQLYSALRQTGVEEAGSILTIVGTSLVILQGLGALILSFQVTDPKRHGLTRISTRTEAFVFGLLAIFVAVDQVSQAK